jgi:CheY-like chemotaxis protein
MANEKMKKVAIKANNILSKAVLIFLFLIPILYILEKAGISNKSVQELIYTVICICILCIIPGIFNKISYQEDAIAMVTLLCIELLFLLLAINPYTEVAIVYVLVPVISLIYCNQRLTQRICLLSYFGMMAAVVYRLTMFGADGETIYTNEVLYLNLLKPTLEFLIVTIIVSYSAGFFENMLFYSMNTEIQPAADGENETSKAKQEYELKESIYDIQTLFHGIESDMLSMIKGKDKFFELELDNHLPVKLYGAREEIRQALSNICSDLLMYHAHAAIKMYVTYDSGILPKKKQNITLIIKISGYTDITSITANKTALGYYLGQIIVGRLKGSFEDLSDSKEAVFRISLLQRVEDETTIEKRKQQQLSQLHQMRSDAEKKWSNNAFKSQIKVLVVDDNRENCKLIDAILSSVGVHVVCTDNGAKAMELLETREYQLVFMDQMMPEKSGAETVKEIRYIEDEYFQNLPIVLMSLNAKEEAKKEYLEMGFSDCISKPIKGNEVRASLKHWIKDDYPLTYAEYKKMMENEDEGQFA